MVRTPDLSIKRAEKNFNPATPLVPIKMNPHSQRAELSVIDMNCFADPAKFPDVMEQQIVLDSGDMEPDLHPAHGAINENYK